MLGGEFQDLMQEEKDHDYRTRRDRQERQNEGWEAQMESLVQAYMLWDYELDPELGLEAARPSHVADATVDSDGGFRLMVLDTYRTYYFHVKESPRDASRACAVIRHGLIPSAPFAPAYAVSIRTLETYRLAHLRCPHLSIEPFVKSLCDMYGAPFRGGLRKAFSKCLDIYLRLRDEVQKLVDAALGRDHSWRLQNACPACTYTLEGEAKLKFKMLVAMDGNESLKRVIRREMVDDPPPIGESDDESSPMDKLPPAPSTELEDSRSVSGGRYLDRKTVDTFTAHRLLPKPKKSRQKAQVDSPPDEEENPCASRWHNMVHENDSRMWGIFDETGVFLSLCRHGYSLVLADMVRSGELSKYPLAVVDALLDAFGADIGGGYDIGCQFATTLKNSSIGEKAKHLNYTALVGVFHGHAHNRLCQLSNLATYVPGLGLEDLEGCERFFSKSNHLAPALRHASPFHRKQKIVEYLQHKDIADTSQNLSKFIVDNYKQALELLAQESDFKAAMADHGVADIGTFERWLAEERLYLKNLAKEPPQDTLKMEYYRKLIKLQEEEDKLQLILDSWNAYSSTGPGQNPSQKNQGQNSAAVQLQHATNRRDRTLAVVHSLETNLGITVQWTEGSEEWEAAKQLVEHRTYRRALDELERLVVSRLFELTKMNMSQTGYKLRKHISKALQARSQAIKTALKSYNTAAAKLKRPRLTWERIVEYAFLSDFDLLRDTREDITLREWANPTSRALMDRYFKIERAREEITRLNIEIRRIITHLKDEDEFLKNAEEKEQDRVLAHHIKRYRSLRMRFSSLHRARFKKLSQLPGFTGTTLPGIPSRNEVEDISEKDGGDDSRSDVETFEEEAFNEKLATTLAIVD
ncbi:hypothetical protein DFP72DRAFT_992049 [Ephemerocybe angulata]|uniref:CxC1-like cysteine cluster associated with KDZ transposases domain-containing protein n=1 Tax=Ephemerocybe angulata TaxID=980116 RepID=A0A8H6HLC1_9AGAR|nr:hypothetical protein DFP72DRAFT_992049 [Tulosesus angulatus]